MPKGVGCSMVGISVRVALDDVHSWCRVCVVRGVWRVLRAPSPSGYEESSEAPQVARGGAQPGRNTGGVPLPRYHLQGRCSPWEPWEDEPAYFKAASGHCVLDVQLGWLTAPKPSDIEPVTVGIHTGGHTGLREFSGTGRDSEWPRDLIQTRSVYRELLRCCMDVLVERGAYGRTVACNTWQARLHAVRRGLSATIPSFPDGGALYSQGGAFPSLQEL